MRNYLILTLLIPLLSGCDREVSDFFDFIDGTKSSTVVLSKKPVRIGIEPLKFIVEKDAQIMGGRAAVCVLLRDNYPLRPAAEMDVEFKKLMREADILSLMQTANGTTIKMGSPNQSWSKYGALGDRDEFSACMNVTLDITKFPPGTSVTLIEISSDAELDVKGIYWESTNRWDKIN